MYQAGCPSSQTFLGSLGSLGTWWGQAEGDTLQVPVPHPALCLLHLMHPALMLRCHVRCPKPWMGFPGDVSVGGPALCEALRPLATTSQRQSPRPPWPMQPCPLSCVILDCPVGFPSPSR